MGKSTNFSGQPIFSQLLNYIDKSEVRKIAKMNGAERYVKKFTTYNHLVVMLFTVFEGYSSLRETILGLLANLLITLVKSRVKRSWAFSNLTSIIRQQLMSYINVYRFLENPEKSWLEIIGENKIRYQDSLFPSYKGAYF